MASPLIGCKERAILYINTKRLDITIKGKPCHPKADVLNKSKEYPSELSISCREKYLAEIFSTSKQDVDPYDECLGRRIFKTNPLFYEYQNYEMIIEIKDDSKISIWHDNNLIREKINYVGKSKRILTGVLNFGAEIGLSEFKVNIDGNEYLKFNIEVFPSKIDYQEDYISILRDVNDEIYNLAFDFLKKTYMWSSLNENVGNSLTEFFSILNIIFDKLRASIDIVLKTPHHVLQQESSVVPFHKIKKSSTATIKWLQKRPNNLILHEGDYLPNKALVINKSISLDTFENRFIKYILKSILKRLEAVKENYKKLKRKTDEEIISRIEKMEREIEKRIESSFLKQVGDLHTLNSLSLVLNMAPGYRDVYKHYLMLIKGLSLNGEVFRMSLKDLAVLYEYWCFIKLNSILKNKYTYKYKLIKQDFLKIDNSGLFVTLTKGKKASITYENPVNGEKFILIYNPQLGRIPTIAQKPDNVLSLEKERSKIRYEYIFDAKYRINPALDGTTYKRDYGKPGPEEDDINTMHRYRDAIVYKASCRPDFERTMFGAYILFPYANEEEYTEHQFYKSISKVNIGGLPFLPSSTHLVEKLLDELIGNTPESTFEKTILPKGIHEFMESIDFNDMNVLVGSLKSEEQLDKSLQYNFYHIPYKNIKTKGVAFKYIALYQSERVFGKGAGIRFFGKIEGWELVMRKEITEILKNSDELYINFKIKEWKKLDRMIRPKEYGVLSHIYTNMQLLENAVYLPELCFKEKVEYRLYLEIKRAIEEIDIRIDNYDIDKANENWFNISGSKVKIVGNMIIIINKGRIKEISIDEFLANPRTVIRVIMDFIGHGMLNNSNEKV